MDNNKARTEFVSDVQKWVSIDTQLKLANEKIRQLRESKNQLTSQICGFVDANNMRDTKLEISDGNLKVYDRKDYRHSHLDTLKHRWIRSYLTRNM